MNTDTEKKRKIGRPPLQEHEKINKKFQTLQVLADDHQRIRIYAAKENLLLSEAFTQILDKVGISGN